MVLRERQAKREEAKALEAREQREKEVRVARERHGASFSQGRQILFWTIVAAIASVLGVCLALWSTLRPVATAPALPASSMPATTALAPPRPH